MKKFISFCTILSFTPFISFAAEFCNTADTRMDSIGHIFNWGSCTLIKFVVPFLFTLATVGFIWGIIQYVLNADNEEKRKKGKNFMIWGLVALFVMISMWGLVGVLANTFGIKTLIPQLSQ